MRAVSSFSCPIVLRFRWAAPLVGCPHYLRTIGAGLLVAQHPAPTAPNRIVYLVAFGPHTQA